MSVRVSITNIVICMLLLSMCTAAYGKKYPRGQGCRTGQTHWKVKEVKAMTDRLLGVGTNSESKMATIYGLVTKFWKDLPSYDEARNWDTNPTKAISDRKQPYTYYNLQINHIRLKPLPSVFCGGQNFVRVNLPKSDRLAESTVFKTNIGDVRWKRAVKDKDGKEQYNHLTFSVEGVKKLYHDYAMAQFRKGVSIRGTKPSTKWGYTKEKFGKKYIDINKRVDRVQLITGGKRQGDGRWSILSFYIAYEKGKKKPAYYAIEVQTANGVLNQADEEKGRPNKPLEGSSTFYIARDMNSLICNPGRSKLEDSSGGCPAGYRFTPFSSADNVYSSKLTLDGDNHPKNIEVNVTSPKGVLYMKLRGPNFQQVPANQIIPRSGTAHVLEALFRLLSLGSGLGVATIDEVDADDGRTMNVIQATIPGAKSFVEFGKNVANSTIARLGDLLRPSLPWYRKPPAKPTDDSVSWMASNFGLRTLRAKHVANWSLYIDCHKAGLSGEDTKNLLRFDFYNGKERLNTYFSRGTRCNWLKDHKLSVKTLLSKGIDRIDVRINGNDALFIDEIEISHRRHGVAHWGRDGGKGWCLRKNGKMPRGWRSSIAGKCFYGISFRFERNRKNKSGQSDPFISFPIHHVVRNRPVTGKPKTAKPKTKKPALIAIRNPYGVKGYSVNTGRSGFLKLGSKAACAQHARKKGYKYLTWYRKGHYSGARCKVFSKMQWRKSSRGVEMEHYAVTRAAYAEYVGKNMGLPVWKKRSKSGKVNGKNAVYVEFGSQGKVNTFARIRKGHWLLVTDQGITRNYRESNRDKWSVYLKSGGQYTAQIDLWKKAVKLRKRSTPAVSRPVISARRQ